MHESSDIRIRTARESEINKIHEIDKEYFSRYWSLKNFEDEYNHPQSFIKTAHHKSRLCGFIVYRIFLDEMHIFRICVIDEFRKTGVGTKLLENSFLDIKNIAKTVFLEVSSKNDKALSFYKKNGFEISGIRNNYYGQGVDALNMTKDLSGGLVQ